MTLGMFMEAARAWVIKQPGVISLVDGFRLELDSLKVGNGATTTSILTGTATYDAPSISNDASEGTNVTVTGAAPGDPAFCTLSTITTAGDNKWFISSYCPSGTTNTVRFTLLNRTGGAVNLASGTIRCIVFKAS